MKLRRNFPGWPEVIRQIDHGTDYDLEEKRRTLCHATGRPETWPSYFIPVTWGFFWMSDYSPFDNDVPYLSFHPPGWNGGAEGWKMRERELKLLRFRSL